MTGIEWTQAVWNPTTGCDRVSPGCDHCYAMTMAKRLKGMGQAKYQRDGDPRTSGPGFGLTVHPDVLDLPLRWRKPRRVFVNSMSDLFHESVPTEFIAQVFAVMAASPQHTFQILTKRHGRMRALLRGKRFAQDVNVAYVTLPSDVPAVRGYHWPLPNVWLGVSAEDQKWADIRIPALLDTPAATRFVSAEPLLGPIRMRASLMVGAALEPKGGINWLIIGGESGPDARPMGIEWARDLAAQGCESGTAVFVKQLGSVLGHSLGAGPKGGDWDAWPEDLRVREYPQSPVKAVA
jgi:protein gp37